VFLYRIAIRLPKSPLTRLYIDNSLMIISWAPFVCRKVNSFGKVNSGESIFRCLVVLWKMNWKTLSSVWLCYGK